MIALDKYNNQYFIGIYDSQNTNPRALAEAVNPHRVLLYFPLKNGECENIVYMSDLIIGKEICRDRAEVDRYYHIDGKQVFLECVRNVLLFINVLDPVNLSFFMGGINALLKEKISTLTVVTSFDIQPLLQLGRIDELLLLERAQSKEKFAAEISFDLEKFLARVHAHSSSIFY
jgi:hypothetical protein